MKAAVVEAPGRVCVMTVDDPTPGRGEILVRVKACGICGTDVHIVDGEFPAATLPLVPGHEFAGEIAAIGPEVAGLLVGERVAIDPALWCGACHFCKEGKHHLCSNRGAIGGTADGGFAEYVVVPYQNAYVVPDAMTFPQAALAEPLSCVVHGVDILQPRLGESCLVVGAGTTGLLFVQLLLRAGAAAVDVVNRTASRLERAKKLGARRVGASVSEMRENSPAGYDCVVDATGIPELVEAAFDAVAPGGKLLVFGVSPAAATVRLPPYRIYRDEITVVGSMGIHLGYGPALRLLAEGALDTELMLTHAFDLADFPRALEIVRRGEGIKVQVTTS